MQSASLILALIFAALLAAICAGFFLKPKKESILFYQRDDQQYGPEAGGELNSAMDRMDGSDRSLESEFERREYDNVQPWMTDRMPTPYPL